MVRRSTLELRKVQHEDERLANAVVYCGLIDSDWLTRLEEIEGSCEVSTLLERRPVLYAFH